ncbi:hypothetical protein ACLOJK_027727, partial [Asimina triloba]
MTNTIITIVTQSSAGFVRKRDKKKTTKHGKVAKFLCWESREEKRGSFSLNRACLQPLACAFSTPVTGGLTRAES